MQISIVAAALLQLGDDGEGDGDDDHAGHRNPIHAHMLRHSAGYALAGRGVDTRTIPALMGHKNIANTVIYTAVADRRVRTIWDRAT